MRRRVRSLCLLVLLLLVVGGGFDVADAQASPSPPPQQPATRTVSRTVSTVITVIIGVFFVLVFVCVLVNQCCDSSAGSSAGAAGGQGQSVVRRRRGLDPAAAVAIPIVPYAEIRKHRSSGLECAVCLTTFDDGNDLRLLPHCSHAFHPDCIDPWLEGHVTCPLCRANLEKQPAPSPAVEFSSPAAAAESQTPGFAPVRLEVVEASDEEERRREEEAVELERLRTMRRAARMPRHSTGHSLCMLSARAPVDGGDHERFTVRLPPHVREKVLKSRRLRHATSLVLGLIRGSSREGSSTGGGARRWPSFLARTVSWARGGVGADSSAKGTDMP